MALKKNFPLDQNPNWFAGYIRVDAMMYDRRQKVLEIVIGFYADEACAMGERPPAATDVVRLRADDENSVEVILHEIHDLVGPVLYETIKATQEKYADAAND